MALTPTLLIPITQLPNAVASQGGPTTPARWWIKRAVFANSDSATHSITVYHVPSGGSPGVSNIIISGFVLAVAGSPGATYVASELTDQIFKPGDTLQCFSDTANKVNVIVSGFVF